VTVTSGTATAAPLAIARVRSGLAPVDAPPGLTAAPSGDGVALDWTAPGNSGEPAPTGYDVSQALAEGGPWTTLPAVAGVGLTRSVTGLIPGTTYFFRVRAVNANGAGPWSPPAHTTTAGTAPVAAPGTVTIRKVKVKPHRKVVVTWSAAPGATGYLVAVRKTKGGPWRTITVSKLKAVLRGKAGQRLWLRVAATNAAGPGPWSRVVKVRVRP
jgi:hypothetical protein